MAARWLCLLCKHEKREAFWFITIISYGTEIVAIKNGKLYFPFLIATRGVGHDILNKGVIRMARGETAIGKIKKGIHYSWKVVWNANKIVLILFFLIDMVQAFCPLMQVYILNLLIDGVMERDLHRSLVLSIIWISILLLGNFLQAFGNYIRDGQYHDGKDFPYGSGILRFGGHGR